MKTKIGGALSRPWADMAAAKQASALWRTFDRYFAFTAVALLLVGTSAVGAQTAPTQSQSQAAPERLDVTFVRRWQKGKYAIMSSGKKVIVWALHQAQEQFGRLRLNT